MDLGKIALIVIIILVGLVLLRNYIPYGYGTTVTNALQIDSSLPTAEGLYTSTLADPLGAVKAGGIMSTVLGVLKFGTDRIRGFISTVRETKAQGVELQSQLSGAYTETVGSITDLKTEVESQASQMKTEVEALKTNVTSQVTEIQTQTQTMASDVSSLKENTSNIQSATNTNTSEIASLKELIQAQQNQINTLIEVQRARSQDPNHSYTGV